MSDFISAVTVNPSWTNITAAQDVDLVIIFAEIPASIAS